MISKKTFVKTLKFIKECREKEEKFISALAGLSQDTYCDVFIYSTYEAQMVSLLAEDLQDEEGDIEYFLYEMDYLQEKLTKVKARAPKGEDNIPLYDSPETLYNYLVSKKGK